MQRSLTSLATVLVISSSLFVIADKALAHIQLTTGTPTKAGQITIRITLNNPHREKIVTVNIPAGTTSVGKAALINQAFQQGQPFVLPPLQQNGNKLIFPNSVKKFEKLNDTTGEVTRLAAVNNQKAKEGQIDGEYIELASTLSGLDGNGNESTFFASLGFETPSESVFASSQFLFSELGGNDIDDWLSTIFTDLQTQLPVGYQSNLSLDLLNDEISFVFPTNILSGSSFIENGTTDINASSSLDLETVPEPTSNLSLLALGSLGAASTLKRKIKPSKSIHKEATKVC